MSVPTPSGRKRVELMMSPEASDDQVADVQANAKDDARVVGLIPVGFGHGLLDDFAGGEVGLGEEFVVDEGIRIRSSA